MNDDSEHQRLLSEYRHLTDIELNNQYVIFGLAIQVPEAETLLIVFGELLIERGYNLKDCHTIHGENCTIRVT